jgi:hypothetical protein
MHHVTPDRARAYGEFLGRRYARFKNLMWMHCGDRNPEGTLAESASELALAIRAQAPHQLHTVHLSPGFASATFFHGDRWLDVNLAYTYGMSYPHVLPEYLRSHPVRPVILGETGYEAEPNAIELLPDARKGDLWTPYRIRRNAWWAVCFGAVGYCAGTRLWRWEENWRDVLNAVSTRQAPLLLQLLGPRPWWRLSPDVRHQFVTAGYGTWNQANYVTAAYADDGRLGIAYLPGPASPRVNLATLSGPIRANWFDPSTGNRKPAVDGKLPNQGDRVFASPGKNSAGEPDWVLVLEVEP